MTRIVHVPRNHGDQMYGTVVHVRLAGPILGHVYCVWGAGHNARMRRVMSYWHSQGADRLKQRGIVTR
jgi:hypothetical protein